MNKLYTSVLLFTFFMGSAQIVNIPDANFKARLLAASPSIGIASTETPDVNGLVSSYTTIDTNGDGVIQVSEVLMIKYLNVVDSNISNLQGINGFLNLETLSCSFNQISTLNVSNLTNLKRLDCNVNQISNINVGGLINLRWLNCANNQISLLDLSGLTSLINLECSNNQLTSLNLSGLTNLNWLNCYSNQLASIDVSSLTNLQWLNCDYNQLQSLNLSGLNNLKELSCNNNLLTSLNVSGLTNLNWLSCYSNQLPSIDVNGLTGLYWLSCAGNQLASLNVNCTTSLQNLNCSNNLLLSIDVSGLTNLQFLNCVNNQLITLFVKNGLSENIIFNINPTLQYICADEGQLASIQNQITQYGYTNCHVNSYCSFTPGGAFYTIQGSNRFDSNTNGCDASDSNLPNLKFAISDGTTAGTFISNTTGSYTIPVQAGTHTVTPIFENPSYFNVSPASVTVSFPSEASPFTQNFCITPNGIVHDVEVIILPVFVARPGFDADYKIIYKNKGNQVANGSLSFTFNDAVMDLVTASPVVSASATNSLSWNYANLLPFETREISLTFNINSPMETPAVNGDDVLNYTATIIGTTDQTPNDNSFTLNQIVVNSFDPNDKTCLEGTTISPSMVGNYVHYVIRFENTGTFAAQNVVIKDMIDTSKFDIATLVPISSSHAFVTRITNTNNVEFIFENINLPFDDDNNDGYVAFKIKTKPTLVLGDTFSNEASIYFDFNFPIITEPAVTSIALLNNQDFDFSSYFTLYPNPAKEVVNLDEKNEIGVKSIEIYNTLGQMILVITNAETTRNIDVSSLKKGTYFIKVVTDRGSSNSKFIKQ